ncbi:ribonuclease Z [Rubripirellula lacrimiformis]|uniref:Ribonuclease Z n=1 Tax=Rubripirellula lacrimiformis TaxID=1930273 RepID=A0A517NEZ4_9BACT|nr:MBL fold metallo-hydrolase [Rubripirellula lacrimiformis]QDT05685.1 ribonuclease Z [Rubripirellula lacrimiformis]
MRLHCLGTVGYHPNDDRHTSCYFLPESGILLDAGTGAFRLSPLIQTDTLNILLSHAHLDHTFGLTFLLDVLFEAQKRRGKPIEKLRIFGEQEKISAVETHLFHDLIFPAKLDAEWIAIDDQPEFTVEGVQVSWRPQDHPGGSVAYRMDWPDQRKRLVYATDTTGDTSEEHARWCEGADLLMHECYFRDDASEWALKTGHSWTSRVAEVTSLSKPKRLLLTHINPIEESDDPIDIEAIRRSVDAEVTLATDGLTLEF